MNVNITRRDVTQQTLDRFRGIPFVWGDSDCVTVAREHLVNAGYDALPEPPEYDNLFGARRALDQMGWGSIEAMLDSVLERRPSAGFARTGDLITLEGVDGMDGVCICAGPLKFFGFSEMEPGLVMMEVPLDEIKGCWKVI